MCYNLHRKKHSLYLQNTTKPCFTPISFTPFGFNAPYKCTPLPNLRPIIFGLTLIGWFISTHVRLFFLMGISFFIHAFLIYAIFSGTQLGQKTRPWCI
jgi:hypothetical protein